MGFWQDLWKKKKGGTRVGNFIRKAAWENTYGLFGTEDGRPRREQEY